MPRMFVPSIAALVLVGCAMDMDHDEMNGAVADVRAEVQRHSKTCQDATTTEATTTELGRHDLTMDRMLGRMESAMGDMRGMHHCGNMDGVGQDITHMRETLQAHRKRVVEARGLGEVHEHCASYGDEMMGLSDTAMQQMRTQGCM